MSPQPAVHRTTPPRYAPEGWLQWPDHPELSFQFLRALGAAQRDAGTVSESLRAASRIDPDNLETWYSEWQALADASEQRAREAEAAGHVHTARHNWLRAGNYHRSSEFYLEASDPRRLASFERVERCTRHYLKSGNPPGEVLDVPMGDGTVLPAYFIKPAGPAGTRWPAVVCFGGLDEYKDEQVHKLPKYAGPRGFAVLLVDLPGQGGALRRGGLHARPDTEVPVGRCVDYLETRADVDPARIALYGSSLGGIYAARAAAFDHRFKAVVSDSLIYDLHAHLTRLAAQPEGLTWIHLRFVFGRSSVEEIVALARDYRMAPTVGLIRCPYLVVQGEADFLGLQTAIDAYERARSQGVDATLRVFTADETGASHCQVDNTTFGMEYVCDWLADRLGIRQRTNGAGA